VIALSFVLIAMSLTDLLRTLQLPRPGGRTLPLLEPALAAVACGCLAALSGLGGRAIDVGVLALVVAAGWAWLTDVSRSSARRVSALTFVGAVLGGAIVAGPLLDYPPPAGQLARWQEHAEIAAVRDAEPAQVLLFVAVLLFLGLTANLIVRLVLGPGPALKKVEAELKGGRLLGPLERFFIFGAALSGQFTAVAAVIAAKGILRFPEISRASEDQSNEAEYVLVGSFVSWAIALASAVVVIQYR
jgi:hypothetical protein